MQQKLHDRLSEAFSNPSFTDEQRKLVGTALETNLVESTRHFTRIYFTFLVAVAVASLVALAQVTEFSILGAKIARTEVLVAFAIGIAAFFYYHAMMLAGFSALLEQGIAVYRATALSPFSRDDLDALLSYPSVFFIESVFRDLVQQSPLVRKVNAATTAVIRSVIIAVPLMWFVWALVYLLTASELTPPFPVAIAVIVVILVLRGVAGFYAATGA